MIFFDPAYFVFMLPALLLALFATALTRHTFSRYARMPSRSGLSGAAAASRLLNASGVTGVSIEASRGFLSDHYDPVRRVLRLSPDVYGSRSLSAIGVACHEAGHAIQHSRGFAPLALRTALVPLAQFGSSISYWLILGGLLLQLPGLMNIGILLFSAAVVFALITLPVEWDASARAKRLMVSCGIVAPSEAAGAARVLNAAFLTYVAGAVTALLQLLYFLMLGRRRN